MLFLLGLSFSCAHCVHEGYVSESLTNQKSTELMKKIKEENKSQYIWAAHVLPLCVEYWVFAYYLSLKQVRRWPTPCPPLEFVLFFSRQDYTSA